jgi:hypothetical protein
MMEGMGTMVQPFLETPATENCHDKWRPKHDTLLTLLPINTGKFLPYVGNQVEFPVPPGILNYSGDNTIGLSIWNQDGDAHASVSVSMKVLAVYASAVDTAGLETAYLRPSWDESRLQYA